MLIEKAACTFISKIAGARPVTDMTCWITFDGARRNSSLWVLYSRLGDVGFLRVDGIIALLDCMCGNTPYFIRVTGTAETGHIGVQ
jgi:hypothetical protein